MLKLLYKTLEFSNFVRKIPLILMKTESKVVSDVNALQNILFTELDSTLNRARAKVLAFLVISLCKVQHVGLFKLANAFDSKAKSASSMRRIQRFLKEVTLDFDKLACFIFKLLPFKGPYVLSMDRTNWQFAGLNINALFIGICYNGVAFPLLFTLLDKRGNSNTSERIAIMERYIRLFGRESIACLLADREFVGKEWLEYLNSSSIQYHIRIKENFDVTRHGRTIKAWAMFGGIRMYQRVFCKEVYIVNGEHCYLSASKVKNKVGKPELEVIVSYFNPEQALDRYGLRWQIETCFKAMKSSGFNIEDTHLVHLDRIEKLFGVMMIAYTWAYLVGDHEDKHHCRIRTKTHGRKEKSIVKYGLDLIARYLNNSLCVTNFDYLKKLSCT